MTASSAADQARAGAWQPRDTAGWLALAASPSFALMAWVAAADAHRNAVCAAGPGILPISGMAAMYLLMNLFHLSPWLKLMSGRRWAH